MDRNDREIRFELLRPGQLIKERERCPLIFVPVAPLEYHGPHLPVGMDPINATFSALETCRRLGKGVVYPTIHCGTERERPAWMLESLGFKATDWVVGMDFPTALWKSHYSKEHLFGLILANEIQFLVDHDYKVIVIVNGHGAVNHQETIDRIAKDFSHTTDALVVWNLTIPDEVLKDGLAGHADIYETSMMLYYQKFFGSDSIVDFSTIPDKSLPIHYPDFSIVDGAGFSKEPDPEKIVRTDPRDAKEALGKELHEKIVGDFLNLTKAALKKKGFL
jgi:creatinine amidohydrolase